MRFDSTSLISIYFFLFFIKLNAQVVNDSILIDGHYRTFHFNLPMKNSANANLIFVLHGSGGNGLKAMKSADNLFDIVNKENLLILFPDGYLKNWNECRKNAPAAANVENIDDNTFFSKMIDYCGTKYIINRQKVFAIGTSGEKLKNVRKTFNIDNSPFTKKLKKTNYSPFSLEFKRIVPTQVFDYNQSFSFDIPVSGNLLYRSFIEIELPILYFTDKIIDDIIYVRLVILFKKSFK